MKLALFAILKSNTGPVEENDDNAEGKELRGKGEKGKARGRRKEEREKAWRVPTWEKRDPVSSLWSSRRRIRGVYGAGHPVAPDNST